MMSAVCLSLHADYECRRSGPCCTSGWPIPVESDRLTAWREALAAGRLSYEADGEADRLPFVVPPGLPSGAGAVLRTRASGACVFYRESDGLCAVQCGLGHRALPATCQHFPRRCLIEPDRVAVSFSHFCPTVAKLAFRTDLAPQVMPAPPALVAPAWSAFSRPLRQFLAAHAFGNWCAYNGQGLRTVVRSLDVALGVVRVEAARACAGAGRPSTSLGTTLSPSKGRPLDETLLAEAFRAADLLLVHLADPLVLARQLSEVEGSRLRAPGFGPCQASGLQPEA